MILSKEDALVFFFSILILSIIKAQASPWCNRTCGSNNLPYPFGFSPGCKIQLNCTRNGEILVNNEFPVQNITHDKIRIHVEPKCNRSIQSFRELFTSNFAPTSTNAILLHKCSSSSLACNITTLNVTTHFESFNCSKESRLSCFFNLTTGRAAGFFDRSSHWLSNCQSLLSSISSNGVTSLEIQVMDLGWWLQGNKCHCSNHAKCSGVISPDGPGYRCQCKNGFHGDGYADGAGCRKASCNLANHLNGQCGGATRIAVLIGVIAAGIAFMVTLGLLCCFIRRRFTSKAKGFTKLHLAETTGIHIPIYPYKEMEKATNSFSERLRLGTGAYGTVYAGKLQNDLWVAIKRIKHRDSGTIGQVMNEIKLISSVNHPNLVRLLGCSIENGEQILVYEFMPNGTLCQHLQRERGDGLAWPVRLTIASETAQAIAHLHSAIHPIFHRDIKSSNILLDYNFRSKVADFGLSRLGITEISHISTAPQGTPGYLDPQYHQNFHLSDRSDVYSFGVVLVEIITALKVVDFSRPQNEVNLAALAADRIGKGRLDEIIDPFLDIHSDAWTLNSVHRVAELAFMCLAFQRDMRPSMMEVAAELEQIRLSRWTPSEELNCTSSSNETCCSSSSNISEKSLCSSDKKAQVENSRILFAEANSENSMEMEKDNSPVSVQDPW